MTALDLKNYIYENNKVEFVLEKIGCNHITYHKEKDYYSCSNAVGGDCNNPSAINIRNNKYLNYRNFTRGVSYEDGEDIISLVQYNKNCDFAEAIKYLHHLFNLKYTWKKESVKKQEDSSWFIFDKFVNKVTKKNVADFTPMNETILDDFMPVIHINLFREGIIGKTIKKFGLGYSYKWKRTIFPIRYWLDGSLMGYNARTSVDNYDLFGIPKYFITPGLKKEINLYGLWENRSGIEKAGYVVLFEAEKSVLKRDSMCDPTGVALEGHSLSKEQIRIILGLNIQEVVIAVDNDVPIEEIWSMCEKFYMLRKVSYIRDRWEILGKKDSPADVENKLYNFLFKYRTVYTAKEHHKYLNKLKKK